MKRKISLILLLFMTFTILSMNETFNENKLKTQKKTVYVCGKSKIYHKSKNHSALKRCKSGIKKMTETNAKKLGKRVCKCRS